MIDNGNAQSILDKLFLLSQAAPGYYLFGAGKFGRELLKRLRAAGLPLPLAILDDGSDAAEIEGVRLMRPEGLSRGRKAPSAPIVLATDTHQDAMRKRLDELFGKKLMIVDLFKKRPGVPTVSAPPPKPAAPPAQPKIPNPGLVNILTGVYRDELKKFQNKHKGRRCFVIGNGPSLNLIDLTLLRDEITFGCNRIYLGFPKWGFHTTYWSVIDKTQIMQSAQEYQQVLASEIVKFIPISQLDYFNLGEFPNCVPVNFCYSPNPYPQFSADPAVLYEGCTVVYMMLQLAVIMGCEPIYMIGVDNRYVIPQENIVRPNRWTDPLSRNHFLPDYCAADKGHIWNTPILEKSDEAFAHAAKWSAGNGNVIFNATPNSALTCFPAVKYEDIFKGGV